MESKKSGIRARKLQSIGTLLQKAVAGSKVFVARSKVNGGTMTPLSKPPKHQVVQNIIYWIVAQDIPLT